MPFPASRSFVLSTALLLLACARGTVLVDATREPSPPASPSPAPPVKPAYADVASRIVEQTNQARVEGGRPRLAAHPRLMRAAQLQAEQMARMGKLAHSFPGGEYPTLQDRMTAAGYEWSAVAENVAIDYRDAAGAVAGWMRSPGHRANLLSATYTEMGAGYAVDARGHRFFAQVFARPVP